MKTDWKVRLTSRRTLGRVIRFELLVALIFAIAGLARLPSRPMCLAFSMATLNSLNLNFKGALLPVL